MGPRDQFAAFFKGTDTSKPTDYEAGIPQALRLMNSPQMAAARLTNVAVRAGEISRGTTPAKAIEKLFVCTLSRRPTTDEIKEDDRVCRQKREPRAGLWRRDVGLFEFV